MGKQAHLVKPVIGSLVQLPRLKHVYGVHWVLRLRSHVAPVKFVGQMHLKSDSLGAKLVTVHVPPF